MPTILLNAKDQHLATANTSYPPPPNASNGTSKSMICCTIFSYPCEVICKWVRGFECLDYRYYCLFECPYVEIIIGVWE